MEQLYIRIFSINNSIVYCDFDSAVILFVLNYIDGKGEKLSVELNFAIQKNSQSIFSFDVTRFLNRMNIVQNSPERLKYCRMPFMYSGSDNYYISGLCLVARQLVKNSGNENLLGYVHNSLATCAESSPMTKFCEIDIINSVKSIFNYSRCPDIVKNMICLESHMRTPLALNDKFRKLFPSAPDVRTYLESPQAGIADLIILPAVHTILTFFKGSLQPMIPAVLKWYELMLHDQWLNDSLLLLKANSRPCILDIPMLEARPEPIYTVNKKGEERYTRQAEVESVLQTVEDLRIANKFGRYRTIPADGFVDWDKLPSQLENVPLARRKRKNQQLMNLVVPIASIACEGDVIVDFCAGSGHLGLMLAVVLKELKKKCKIILVEYKERSLELAMKEIRSLKLKDVVIVRSNLDYLIADFQIGIALHACGVATDLILTTCINRRAKFVVSPCCYGRLHVNHILKYPRSTLFSTALTLREYLVLGHCADQTQATCKKVEQGEKCMNIIDLDRCLYAKEKNYEVCLVKMNPACCTPKNNFMIGIPKEIYGNYKDIFLQNEN